MLICLSALVLALAVAVVLIRFMAIRLSQCDRFLADEREHSSKLTALRNYLEGRLNIALQTVEDERRNSALYLKRIARFLTISKMSISDLTRKEFEERLEEPDNVAVKRFVKQVLATEHILRKQGDLSDAAYRREEDLKTALEKLSERYAQLRNEMGQLRKFANDEDRGPRRDSKNLKQEIERRDAEIERRYALEVATALAQSQKKAKGPSHTLTKRALQRKTNAELKTDVRRTNAELKTDVRRTNAERKGKR